MLHQLAEWIRRSPFGPAAGWLRRRLLPGSLAAKNERYDRQTVAVMQRVLRADSNCIDVGAHSGSVLVDIVRLAPGGQHFAFEPLPWLAEKLRARYPRVRVHQSAVGAAPGRTEFVHVVNDPAYSGLRERSYDRADPQLERLPIEVVRLDDVIPADLPIAFLKLDIEGGEFDALRGAAALLRRCRPHVVFEAGARSSGHYGVTPEALCGWFAEQGYRLTTMARWLAGQPAMQVAEFVHNWQHGPDYYFLAEPVQG